jgi:aspartate carbamoyltransferase catalytic subunit
MSNTVDTFYTANATHIYGDGSAKATAKFTNFTSITTDKGLYLDTSSLLNELDVVNVLRIQFERQRGGLFPSIREYYRLFGVTAERMARAKPSLLLLAPGPINRGVELTPEVADGPNSAILDQVANGLGIRMAVLSLLAQAQTSARLGNS